MLGYLNGEHFGIIFISMGKFNINAWKLKSMWSIYKFSEQIKPHGYDKEEKYYSILGN